MILEWDEYRELWVDLEDWRHFRTGE